MNLDLATLMRLVKKFSYGERPHPWRDWFIIILVALILTIGAAGWSYVLFVQVSAGDILGSAPSASEDASTATLDAVRTTFEKRAIERTHYLTDYHFVDPSK